MVLRPHLWISLHSEMLLVIGMIQMPALHGQSYARQKASRNFDKILPRKVPRTSGNAGGLEGLAWVHYISRSREKAKSVNLRAPPMGFQENPLSGVAERTL
jgi:hypothetical protein